MFRKLLNKIQNNEGVTAIQFVAALPLILMILFVSIDFYNLSNAKANLQRRLDALTLGIVAKAAPDADTFVDAEGTILIGDREGLKVCELVEDDFEEAYDRLERDAYDIQIVSIDEISHEDEMDKGVAKITVTAKATKFLVNGFLNDKLEIKYRFQSVSVCDARYAISEEEDGD